MRAPPRPGPPIRRVDGATTTLLLSDKTNYIQDWRAGQTFVGDRFNTRWASMGWERSWLGYPIGDAKLKGSGFQRYYEQDFQHGFMRWFVLAGKVYAYRRR